MKSDESRINQTASGTGIAQVIGNGTATVTIHQYAPLHSEDYQHLLQSLTELPFGYTTRIENFLTEYLGSARQPIPFGGREVAMAELDTWLSDDDTVTPPYLFLGASAGRGKSALLCRWSQRLLAQENLAVIFVPISIRFRTNLPTVFYAALTAQLARLYGEPLPTFGNLSAEMWREMAAGYLERAVPEGHRLLVILDGLDEVAGNDWPGPDFFPSNPPDGLRLVVSARYLVGDTSSSAWLLRLGWDYPDLAYSLELGPLTQDGVADVLTKMGVPLDLLGARDDIVAKLHYLSDGDPLLVRLFVDDLWQKREVSIRLQPEDLYQIEPGYEGYFSRWWDDQRNLWGDSAPLKEKVVREVLSLLATAFGPLMAQDLLQLNAPEVDMDSFTLKESLRPLARFVIGDGINQAYTFSHSKLGEYFYREYVTALAGQWEERFLKWGRETLIALNEERIKPQQVPAYILQYYSAHLKRGEAPIVDYLLLLSNSWGQAWEAFEGVYSGFMSDVQRVWDKACSVNQVALDTGQKASHLGTQALCVLCQTSINSIGTKLPSALIVQLVKHKVWTPFQGITYSRLLPSEWSRSEVLAGIAPHLSETLLDEALVVARQIEAESARSRALIALVPHLSSEQREEALAEALEVARKLEHSREEALTALAPHLSEAQLSEALEAARQIKYDLSRVKALTALIPYLPSAQHERVFNEALVITQSDTWSRPRTDKLIALAPHWPAWLQDEALEMTRQLKFGDDKAKALAALVPHLPSIQREEVLGEALSAVRGFPLPPTRVEALVTLVPHLSENQLYEALMVTRQTKNVGEWRMVALEALAPRLPGTLLDEALAVANQIRDELSRVKALVALVPYLPLEQRKQVVSEALILARKIKNRSSRVKALGAVIQHLPSEQRAKIAGEALEDVQQISYVPERGRPLVALAQNLPDALLTRIWSLACQIDDEFNRSQTLESIILRFPETLLGEMLKIARQIGYERSCVPGLVALAPHLPEAMINLVLTMARHIGPEVDRVEALAALVPHLPSTQREEVLGEALTVTQQIWFDGDRARALGALAPHLSEKLLGEAWTVAREIESEGYRLEALASLSPYLPEKLLDEAWTVARQLNSTYQFSEALGALAPQLPENSLNEALEVVQHLTSTDRRAKALAVLSPYLPSEQGKNAVSKALTIARQIEEAQPRAAALVAIAPNVPSEQQEEVVGETLETIRQTSHKVISRELIALANNLPEMLLTEVWSTACQIESEYDRAKTLKALASHLPESLLNESLEVAGEIESSKLRAEVLATLLPHLTSIPNDHVYRMWEEILLLFAQGTREELLSNLQALAPIIERLGGKQAAIEIAEEIMAVSRWWP